MKRIVMAVIACLVLGGAALADEHPKEHPKANPAAAATGAGALDGKVFVGELVKSGEKSGDKDRLSFEGGKFVSSACVQYGFHEAAYTATEKDGVITFTANPTNADGETMSWTGTITEGAVECTAVHKSKSGETTYAYKGKAGHAQADSKDKSKKSEHPDHPKN